MAYCKGSVGLSLFLHREQYSLGVFCRPGIDGPVMLWFMTISTCSYFSISFTGWLYCMWRLWLAVPHLQGCVLFHALLTFQGAERSDLCWHVAFFSRVGVLPWQLYTFNILTSMSRRGSSLVTPVLDPKCLLWLDIRFFLWIGNGLLWRLLSLCSRFPLYLTDPQVRSPDFISESL